PHTLDAHLAEHPTQDVLRDAGFEIVGEYEFLRLQDWTIPELLGWIYSTSVLPRPILGDDVDAFERDLETRMRAIEPSGVFRENVSFAYDLAVTSPRREGSSR